MFSLRIITVDHYQSVPVRDFDVCYSDFRGCEIYKVPILRVFGLTPVGQKTCLHVHGVFPYLLIVCDEDMPKHESDLHFRKFTQELSISIDRAINVALRNSSSHKHHVYKMVIQQGIPFYGYHESSRPFLKIYFYNPNDIKRVAELFAAGAIMNKVIQPYEAHIPYILQFFIDNNLFGMNFLNVAELKFRVTTDEHVAEGTSPSLNPLLSQMQVNISNKVWSQEEINNPAMCSRMKKLTSCELEADCTVHSILNKLDVGSVHGNNPGILAIWEEERQRRREKLELSQITPPTSQERPPIMESESETFYKERLKKLLDKVKDIKTAIGAPAILGKGYSNESPVSSQRSLDLSSSFSNTQDNELLNAVLSMVNSQSSSVDHDSILSQHATNIESEDDDAITLEMSQCCNEDPIVLKDGPPTVHESYMTSVADRGHNSQSIDTLYSNCKSGDDSFIIPQLDGAGDDSKKRRAHQNSKVNSKDNCAAKEGLSASFSDPLKQTFVCSKKRNGNFRIKARKPISKQERGPALSPCAVIMNSNLRTSVRLNEKMHEVEELESSPKVDCGVQQEPSLKPMQKMYSSSEAHCSTFSHYVKSKTHKNKLLHRKRLKKKALVSSATPRFEEADLNPIKRPITSADFKQIGREQVVLEKLSEEALIRYRTKGNPRTEQSPEFVSSPSSADQILPLSPSLKMKFKIKRISTRSKESHIVIVDKNFALDNDQNVVSPLKLRYAEIASASQHNSDQSNLCSEKNGNVTSIGLHSGKEDLRKKRSRKQLCSMTSKLATVYQNRDYKSPLLVDNSFSDMENQFNTIVKNKKHYPFHRRKHFSNLRSESSPVISKQDVETRCQNNSNINLRLRRKKGRLEIDEYKSHSNAKLSDKEDKSLTSLAQSNLSHKNLVPHSSKHLNIKLKYVKKTSCDVPTENYGSCTNEKSESKPLAQVTEALAIKLQKRELPKLQLKLKKNLWTCRDNNALCNKGAKKDEMEDRYKLRNIRLHEEQVKSPSVTCSQLRNIRIYDREEYINEKSIKILLPTCSPEKASRLNLCPVFEVGIKKELEVSSAKSLKSTMPEKQEFSCQPCSVVLDRLGHDDLLKYEILCVSKCELCIQNANHLILDDVKKSDDVSHQETDSVLTSNNLNYDHLIESKSASEPLASKCDVLVDNFSSESKNLSESVSLERNVLISNSAFEYKILSESVSSEHDVLVNNSSFESENLSESVSSECDIFINDSYVESKSLSKHFPSEHDDLINDSYVESKNLSKPLCSEHTLINDSYAESRNLSKPLCSEYDDLINDSYAESKNLSKPLSSEHDLINDSYAEPKNLTKPLSSEHDDLINDSYVASKNLLKPLSPKHDDLVNDSCVESKNLSKPLSSEHGNLVSGFCLESKNLSESLSSKYISLNDSYVKCKNLCKSPALEHDNLYDSFIETKNLSKSSSESNVLVDDSFAESLPCSQVLKSKDNIPLSYSCSEDSLDDEDDHIDAMWHLSYLSPTEDRSPVFNSPPRVWSPVSEAIDTEEMDESLPGDSESLCAVGPKDMTLDLGRKCENRLFGANNLILAPDLVTISSKQKQRDTSVNQVENEHLNKSPPLKTFSDHMSMIEKSPSPVIASAGGYFSPKVDPASPFLYGILTAGRNAQNIISCEDSPSVSFKNSPNYPICKDSPTVSAYKDSPNAPERNDTAFKDSTITCKGSPNTPVLKDRMSSPISKVSSYANNGCKESSNTAICQNPTLSAYEHSLGSPVFKEKAKLLIGKNSTSIQKDNSSLSVCVDNLSSSPSKESASLPACKGNSGVPVLKDITQDTAVSQTNEENFFYSTPPSTELSFYSTLEDDLETFEGNHMELCDLINQSEESSTKYDGSLTSITECKENSIPCTQGTSSHEIEQLNFKNECKENFAAIKINSELSDAYSMSSVGVSEAKMGGIHTNVLNILPHQQVDRVQFKPSYHNDSNGLCRRSLLDQTPGTQNVSVKSTISNKKAENKLFSTSISEPQYLMKPDFSSSSFPSSPCPMYVSYNNFSSSSKPYVHSFPLVSQNIKESFSLTDASKSHPQSYQLANNFGSVSDDRNKVPLEPKMSVMNEHEELQDLNFSIAAENSMTEEKSNSQSGDILSKIVKSCDIDKEFDMTFLFQEPMEEDISNVDPLIDISGNSIKNYPDNLSGQTNGYFMTSVQKEMISSEKNFNSEQIIYDKNNKHSVLEKFVEAPDTIKTVDVEQEIPAKFTALEIIEQEEAKRTVNNKNSFEQSFLSKSSHNKSIDSSFVSDYYSGIQSFYGDETLYGLPHELDLENTFINKSQSSYDCGKEKCIADSFHPFSSQTSVVGKSSEGCPAAVHSMSIASTSGDQNISLCNSRKTLLLKSKRYTEPSENSTKFSILKPKIIPPSKHDIKMCGHLYNIPEESHQIAFFSDPKDLDSKSSEISGLVCQVKPHSKFELPEFDSMFHNVENTDFEKHKFSTSQISGSFLVAEDGPKKPELKVLFCNDKPIVQMPNALPPSRSKVTKWLQHQNSFKNKDNSNSNEGSRIICSDNSLNKANHQAEQKIGSEELLRLSQSPICPLNIKEKLPYSKLTIKPCSSTPVSVKVNKSVKPSTSKLSKSKRLAVITENELEDGGRISPLTSSFTSLKKRKLSFDTELSKVLRKDCENHGSKTEVFKDTLSPNNSFLHSLLNKSSSQIDGPLLENSGNFKFNLGSGSQNYVSHENQHLTLMSIEIHVNTRKDLCPNPEYDSVTAVFFCVSVETEQCPNIFTGIIAIDDCEKQTYTPLRTELISTPEISPNLVFCVKTENQLFEELANIVQQFDPEFLIGYEIKTLSVGYLIQRASHLKIDLKSKLSRLVDESHISNQCNITDDPDVDTNLDIHIAGRIILNVWQLMKKELALTLYSFENVYYHVLHKRIPLYSYKSLTMWFKDLRCSMRWKVIKYYIIRVQGSLCLLEQLNVIGQTSELARLFGIQFFEVLSRGSQFRVESMMLRSAKPLSYVPVSPTIQQRSLSRAPECVPLIFEPESRFYTDPVLILDFQSLYPSMIIAYNYCFSTCLGRVEHFGSDSPFEFGCTSLSVPVNLLQKLESNVHISPTGVAFVKSNVKRGILPIMLEEILNTRIMVKQSLKLCKSNKALSRLLDSRQLGLKLIANVTYGYTSANFSGRMPCVEVADSIVGKGRETLERAIRLIEESAEWKAKVVYGDTDSVFVLLPGRNKEQAFKIGQDIADAVTALNPKPVKLKFEKVYFPCILQTKKRYVGYMYETLDQKEPVFDAKGIETVRRDSCPAVGKILEKSIKLLFDTRDVSLVKKYVQKQFEKFSSGRVNLADCIFAKEYRGRSGYRPGACVPSLEIAKKRSSSDPRAEPLPGERVPYVVVYGFPGLPIIQLVKEPLEFMNDWSLRINAKYYITRVIAPPLERIFSLIGVDVKNWYANVSFAQVPSLYPEPFTNKPKNTLSQYFKPLACPACDKMTNFGVCDTCSRQPQRTAVILSDKVRQWERNYHHLSQICQSCSTSQCFEDCISVACPVFFQINQAQRDLSQVSYLRNILLNELF